MLQGRKRLCFALDLKDDPALIEQYRQHHADGKVWPEIEEGIRRADIHDMEIYCTGNRLFMIIEVDDTFDPEKKQRMDAENPRVQAWEKLMDTFQSPLPWAAPGEKWTPMDRIFRLRK